MIYILGVFVCSSLSAVIAQQYTATPLSIKKCDVLAGNEIDVTYQLKEDKGSKYFTMDLNIDEEISDQFNFRATVEMMNRGYYIHYLEADGKMCESISKIGKVAYDRLRKEMKPPLTQPCSIPPGKYKLDLFKIKKDEIDVPIPTAGQFRAQFHMFRPDGNEISCMTTEFIIEEEEEDDDE